MAAVLIIAPGILAAAYFCSLKKQPIKSIEFLVYSVLFIFLINLFVFFLAWLSGLRSSNSANLFTTTSNVLKYGLVGGVSAFVFPNLLVLPFRFHFGKKHE